MKIIDNHIITSKEYFSLDNVACIELKRYGKINPLYTIELKLSDNQSKYKDYEADEAEAAVGDFNQLSNLIMQNANFVQERNVLINMDLVREVDFTYGMQGVNIEFPSFHRKILGLGYAEAEKSVSRLLKKYLENISRKTNKGEFYENATRC